MDGWCSVEELPSPANDAPEPIRDIPSGDGGYLAQPDMRRLITTALELDWSLWAYEAAVDFTGQGPDPWVRDRLAEQGGTLAAHGGCAGILREQAPPPLDSPRGGGCINRLDRE